MRLSEPGAARLPQQAQQLLPLRRYRVLRREAAMSPARIGPQQGCGIDHGISLT